MTATAEQQIRDMVVRETRAWDTQDVELSVFHPDMVWPWPRSPESHDPLDWVMGFGRYHPVRWRERWQGLVDEFELVHNRRQVRGVQLAEEGDAALAVVDIDTLWRAADGREDRWRGRVSKGYTRMPDGWKLIMHTGVLHYGAVENPGGTS